jgi:hypothetical protein
MSRTQLIKKSQPQNYIEWYTNSESNPNKKFLEWIGKVEKFIDTKLQLTLIDLPDEDYMRYFESGYSFLDMVSIILESNGYII